VDVADPVSRGSVASVGRVERENGIEVEGLVREYRKGPRAVDGIDLSVAPGEIYGFLGPNGACNRGQVPFVAAPRLSTLAAESSADRQRLEAELPSDCNRGQVPFVAVRDGAQCNRGQVPFVAAPDSLRWRLSRRLIAKGWRPSCRAMAGMVSPPW